MQKNTTKKQKNGYNTTKQAGATYHTPAPASQTFSHNQTTTMKKRNLVKATLATGRGTPLAMSNEFKDRAKTAKDIEENKTPETTKTILRRDAYIKDRTLDRTHETKENTIIETRTGEDSMGNKHNLYLEWKPTTELLNMRYNS